MGESQSKTPQTLAGPWRKYSWLDKKKDLDYVKNYQPQRDIEYMRVLIYGPVGAGKSSFISSVTSVVTGKQTGIPVANATESRKSFTKKYKTHKIRKNGKSYYPFVLTDMMGLEEGDGCGVRTSDIKLALKGHVKDNYKFKTKTSLKEDDKFYTSSPSPEDKVHVLVCVVSANTTELTMSILDKIKDIRMAATDLGIPQAVIITNIDAACKETDNDLKNVYRSRHIQEKVKEISLSVGFPLNCIFPVKNYSEDIKADADMEGLILSALRQIIDFGENFINTMET